ncbi:MAG: hypothetical protein JNM93_04625 [Bacteriovoracaceae bacterium]|nr:hypothetical protein [Bacteriovoracaceae bacterium]
MNSDKTVLTKFQIKGIPMKKIANSLLGFILYIQTLSVSYALSDCDRHFENPKFKEAFVKIFEKKPEGLKLRELYNPKKQIIVGYTEQVGYFIIANNQRVSEFGLDNVNFSTNILTPALHPDLILGNGFTAIFNVKESSIQKFLTEVNNYAHAQISKLKTTFPDKEVDYSKNTLTAILGHFYGEEINSVYMNANTHVVDAREIDQYKVATKTVEENTRLMQKNLDKFYQIGDFDFFKHLNQLQDIQLKEDNKRLLYLFGGAIAFAGFCWYMDSREN